MKLKLCHKQVKYIFYNKNKNLFKIKNFKIILCVTRPRKYRIILNFVVPWSWVPLYTWHIRNAVDNISIYFCFINAWIIIWQWQGPIFLILSTNSNQIVPPPLEELQIKKKYDKITLLSTEIFSMQQDDWIFSWSHLLHSVK